MQRIKKIPNAQKWDADRVWANLLAIERLARQDDIAFLGSALVKQGLYSGIWSYWKRAFAGHDDIIEIMLGIETIFEAKLFEQALRKEVSPWVAIFGLKNNHQWDTHTEHEPLELSEPQKELPPEPQMTISLGAGRVITVP